MNNNFDIERILTKLRSKRKIFVSEADFQLEMAWIIKEEYPNTKVRLEYCPSFDSKMHIDILVIMNNEWIPIELKYKTKSFTYDIDNEKFELKGHGAKDINCYLYLKDIQRIEKIKKNVPEYKIGYTVFITNDLCYMKNPRKSNCVYKEFSLEDGIIKKGTLNWSKEASEGTKKNCENPIKLKGTYPIKWKNYSKINDTNTGVFMYLVNEIIK